MRKGLWEFWRRLGRVEKAFLGVLIIYLLVRVSGQLPAWRIPLALATFILGLFSIFRVMPRLLKGAIWRLRNRLIVAYLFIAVVPVTLVLALAFLTGYGLIGQVAAYFVRGALTAREGDLFRRVEFLTSSRGMRPRSMGQIGPMGPIGASRGQPGPGQNQKSDAKAPAKEQTNGRKGPPRGFFPQFPAQQLQGRGGVQAPAGGAMAAESPAAISGRMLRFFFPEAEMLASGREEVRIPAENKISHPPKEWGRASGLVLKEEENGKRVYIWAHVLGTDGDVKEVTVMVPVTGNMLSDLVPKLGDVAIDGYVPAPSPSRVPPPVSRFDIAITAFYPISISSWRSPAELNDAEIFVYSRLSAVLGLLFERTTMGETMRDVFLGVLGLFILVEIFALRAGIRLTRSITGSVHELYEGTQRVKEGDFAYRIPVKGNDQLADLSSSFNTMTENLGQLIVVAQEKERLQSELQIAREVQNQLFPRDVPSLKNLELKGVCMPARVVSGDYYDFMPLPGAGLAFAIGDVAGKGISAALLMATIQSAMRTQLSILSGNGARPVLSAARLVAQLNKQLYANTTPEKYATFYFALYDEGKHEITYTNAGHLPPLLVRNGECTCLNPTGTVVGAFPFAKYEERTVTLEERDVLVAYTDGIVEPENPYGEMFGDNRLRDLVLRYAFSDSSEIIARAMEAVKQWTGTSELQDDMTMVVARRV